MIKKIPLTLIGKEIEVRNSLNPDARKIKGKIVDETKFTLKIKTQGKTKTLLKKSLTFKIDHFIMEGKDLAKRMEERIKG